MKLKKLLLVKSSQAAKHRELGTTGMARRSNKKGQQGKQEKKKQKPGNQVREERRAGKRNRLLPKGGGEGKKGGEKKREEKEGEKKGEKESKKGKGRLVCSLNLTSQDLIIRGETRDYRRGGAVAFCRAWIPRARTGSVCGVDHWLKARPSR